MSSQTYVLFIVRALDFSAFAYTNILILISDLHYYASVWYFSGPLSRKAEDLAEACLLLLHITSGKAAVDAQSR